MNWKRITESRYVILLDIVLSGILTMSLYVFVWKGWIAPLHWVTYVLFGGMVLLLLVRARKKEQRSKE